MKSIKRGKGFFMAALLLSFVLPLSAESKTNDYMLAEKIEDGAILHTWCWSFKTITKNMSEIAAAGFSAIQTSPISQCLVGEDGGFEIFGHGKWYYHYQPTKYVIGNYQLGTEKDFIAMCEQAHKYGIKVIVDTVINHCTATYNAIDGELRNMEGGGFHPQNGGWSEVDRYEETQFALSGLWDLNTQNPKIQNHILTFLKRCVKDGADGFRYDAAKLIELPDDVSAKYGDKFASNFWPTVLNNGAAFQYGEVLQEGGKIFYSSDMKSGYDDSLSSRLAAYHKYMKTTNSMYGFRIRDAASHNNFNADFVSDNVLPKGASSKNVVTWVESHDNYCNDASYKELNPEQVIRAWAVIASRKNGTPLFFDRPKGSTENSPWGENILGNAGSNMFKDPQVVEVNFFRDAMAGSEEALSNPTKEDEVLFIERGNNGLVIVNSSSKSKNFEGVAVKLLSDGEYNEQVRGDKFIVKDGKLSGTVPPESVSVVYNKTGKTVEFESAIEASVPSGYFLDDEFSFYVSTRSVTDATCAIEKNAPFAIKDGQVITIGKDVPYGKTIQVTLNCKDKNGRKLKKKYSYRKSLYKKDTVVYLDVKSMGKEWGTQKVCVYIYNEDGSKANASWPGVKMEEVSEGIYKYVLPYELESQKTYVIFNNGGGGEGNQYPNGAGLEMFKGTKMILDANKRWNAYK